MKLFRHFALALACMTAGSALAQTAQPGATSGASQASSAKAEDVQSIEAIVAALYDVISGPPGERDWKRFHSLFIPEGRLIFNGKNDKGEYVRRVMTLDDYQQRAGEHFKKEGFFERGVANHVDRYGAIAQVFSTYESRHEKNGEPFTGGINSIQLAFDGQRWWVVTILWDSKRPDNPIPPQYAK